MTIFWNTWDWTSKKIQLFYGQHYLYSDDCCLLWADLAGQVGAFSVGAWALEWHRFSPQLGMKWWFAHADHMDVHPCHMDWGAPSPCLSPCLLLRWSRVKTFSENPVGPQIFWFSCRNHPFLGSPPHQNDKSEGTLFFWCLICPFQRWRLVFESFDSASSARHL